ncbi:restriction endonuclease [Corynebacterium xerosis]|uniref:site-specific DNA-methyltransferase (adenine-specific) n=1 Tax=Corynebacterium xerosis TaxID=1725 RepID=A0A2N6SXB9_9CORY|nr:BREX-1 system adenine-specific DNA-methyltransferase PglX [Corynebacterium xerosis]PMC61708.1 restriction endonuclease [Corynebacterium xerosis]
METAPLKSFATWARRELITQVSARLTAVLAPASPERVENQRAVTMLERDIAAAGGGAKGKEAVTDKVAYTWFNRIIALRFMDANSYTGVGVVSPAHGQQTGQPEILADAKRGSIDPAVVSNKRTLDAITGLLDGTRPSPDAQGEAYTLLLAEYCRYWNRSMPFMFEREGDYSELLIPANLLAAGSILSKTAATLTAGVCRDVEVIGWLYQFYISERKDEVFAGFKKGKKAGAAEIPAATQLFTPHWIVRYLVENSLGRLWVLNHPSSRLIEQMDYYVAPLDEETDFLKISSPEELKIIDPACGSGHMLTYAFDLLYAIYEEEGYAPSEIPELILTYNLYGTEIDPRAGALAAFALTMKARARQRTFLGRRVKPNICVLEPTLFSPDELEYLVTEDGDKHAEELFWNQFAAADTLGSLIQPDPTMTRRIAEHLATLDDEDDILRADTLDRAARVLSQAEFLAQRYCVVVANPPYMGSKNMGATLAYFASGQFPDSKSDLFAVFIERGFEFLTPGGLSAMVTMQSWMFLKSYAELRKKLINDRHLECMVHMGNGVMGIAFGTAAAVWRSTTGSGDSSFSYVSTLDLDGDRPSVFPTPNSRHTEMSLRELSAIPGSPIAYWASSALRATFQTGRTIESAAPVRQGFQTGDNDRFLRFWHEVSRGRVTFDAESTEEFHAGGARFAPYLKGGPLRKWFGNDEYVVAFNPQDFSELSKLGNKLPSRNLYFKDAVTWSAMSSSDFGARYAGVGSTFSAKGACAFPADGYSRSLTLAVLNSSVARQLLEFMGATMDFNVGSLREIPLPVEIPPVDQERISSLVELLVDFHRRDWNLSESAPGYEENALLKRGGDGRLAGLVDGHIADWRAYSAQVGEAQNTLDAVIAESYGLQSSGELKVTLNNLGVDSQGRAERNTQVGDLIADLVSFAVGCMFGRYSLDEPGLILADQDATVTDYLAKVPQPTLAPDADNVLPIVDGDWFEDDIVARFRQFLRVAFGEKYFEENLRFVEESLGVKALREYFVTRAGRSRFYEDHVKRYKKRPIYWLFSSPKGSFNALIYMHRYTPSTVSTVLNEYLREFESKLEANLQHQERLAAGDGAPREKAAALKEAERLRKVLVELGEYEHDVLYPLASQQIAIDLDDGVKANYPKFYPALKKIAGLEATDD